MRRRAASGSASSVVALATVAAVLMIAQQVASKAVRDGFFLSEYPVTALPVATLAAAAVSLAAALLLGRFISAFSPAAAVPVLFAGNGLLFFVEASLVHLAPRTIAAALYLHTAAFGGAVISGFWSVINERFDPYTARKVVSRVAGGATLGGIVGGALTWLFADAGAAPLLAAFGASSVLCAVAVGFIGRGSQSNDAIDETSEPKSSASALVTNPYLRRVGTVVVFGALMTGLIDYVFKAGVTSHQSGDELVGFFAVFYTAVGVATFIVQALGSRRILSTLGVVPTAGLFPATALSLLLLALLWPGLITLVLLRGGAMMVENSLYRAGYELFYTPVPKSEKRAAKMLIDLGCDRLGTAAASGVALLAITIGAATANQMLLLIAVACAVVIAILMTVIRRDYIASLATQLRESLRSGTIERGASQSHALAATFVADMGLWPGVTDSTASQRSITTSGPIELGALLAQVKAQADQKRKRQAAAAARAPQPTSTIADEYLATPLRQGLRSIAPGEPGWAELRQAAPGVIGQLGDILLSRRETIEARLSAAELLASAPSQRAADALLAVLASPNLRLRRACALALLAICSTSPRLRPPRRLLVELAGNELQRPSHPVQAQRDFERASPFLRDARGNELVSSLELVFILLAIGGHVNELRLALTAITSEDSRQRGTGLEYLDNLLPADLRRRLIGLVETPELTQAELRAPRQAIEQLANDLRAGKITLAQLRQRYQAALRAEYEAKG